MKTKIISIVVMLLMACNVMAQYDFMTLHFNNDSCPSRRFYWPDVTKFTQSKYDKDGVLHDSYQTQEIWIRDSIYSYSLMDIDSITFTKFNKEEAKQNFISAMNSTTKLTHGCKTITEVELVLDQLNGSEGVERAWIDGTTLHVTSINGYTIDFYYDLIKPEENDTDDSEPYNIPEYKFYAPAWGQDYSFTGYKPRVLFINLLSEDETFSERSKVLRDLENAFNYCLIETNYITETKLRSNSEEIDKEEFHIWEKTIFEYDKVIYNAHGGFSSELNMHSICLSNELARKLSSEEYYDQTMIEEAYNTLDFIHSQYENCSEQDIRFGGIHFKENDIEYNLLCVSITENFFDKYVTGKFDRDKDPIVFSGSCHSLDGNDNMPQIFLGRGAKVYFGYKNSNWSSQYAAFSLFYGMLKGKTVIDAYNGITDSYRKEPTTFEDFKFVPGGILEPRYSNEKYDSNLRLGNTFTKDIDFETARAEFISNKKVTISGVTGIVNPSDPDIECGFRYGILKNDLNKTIKASEQHYSEIEPLGNFYFSAKLDMSEYQNYYYQAYTRYDDSYCYGDIYQIIFYLIKEIYLDPTSATLKVGESLTIKATFNPANPPNKELDWESSDESIATVSHGIVNAKAVGRATITAKATDGSGVTATCEILVIDDLALSQTLVTLEAGTTTTVEITSGCGDYTVDVDDPSVAKASEKGSIITIEGVTAGPAVVTVKDNVSEQTADINVTVSSPPDNCPVAEAIDLGLPSGLKWASWNVGATKPEEYGGYYAWGETEEKDEYFWTTYSHCDGVQNSCHDIGTDIAGTEYDVAHMKWGDAWRMPTYEETRELIRYCSSKETDLYGVHGFEFTGPNGNWIFLPAAGYKFRTDLRDEGVKGSYWESTVRNNINYGYELLMSSDYIYADCYINRFAGLPIRPVWQDPK